MKRTQNSFNARRLLGTAGTTRGFTLLEMLMVISLIVFLLGVLIVVAGVAHRQSQRDSTALLIEGMESALDTYYKRFGLFPVVKHSSAGNLGQVLENSVELYDYLTGERFGNCMPTVPEGSVQFVDHDGKSNTPDKPYFVDAWLNPIRYVAFDMSGLQQEPGEPMSDAARKWAMNGGLPLLWSLGPNGRGWSVSQISGASAGSLQSYMWSEDEDNSDNITNYKDIPANAVEM